MSDAAKAREIASNVAKIAIRLEGECFTMKCYKTRSAIEDCITILNTEHDRLVEAAADMDAEAAAE